MLRDSTVVTAVVRTRPRAIPLTMITTRKSTHGFPFVSHIWVAYGAPLGGPSGCRSSAINGGLASATLMSSAIFLLVNTGRRSLFIFFPRSDSCLRTTLADF